VTVKLPVIAGNKLQVIKLEKAAQGVAQCEVSATLVVVETPRCYVVERADAAVTELQMSPVIVDGSKNGFHQWIQRIFLVLVEGK